LQKGYVYAGVRHAFDFISVKEPLCHCSNVYGRYGNFSSIYGLGAAYCPNNLEHCGGENNEHNVVYIAGMTIHGLAFKNTY